MTLWRRGAHPESSPSSPEQSDEPDAGGGLTRFVVPMLPFPLEAAVFIRFEVD
jgi:hypothetical protein